MKKRLLSLLLALCLAAMTTSFAAVPAAAASQYDQAAVERQLDELMAQYCGTYWGGNFNGATQCKGFADMIYHRLFGTGAPGPYTSSRYIISPLNQTVSLGTVAPGEISEQSVTALLRQAIAGDYVQMVRYTGTQHSAIVVSVSDTEITFFDCNLKGNALCACYSYTWAEVARYLSGGVSLYRHAGYEPSGEYRIYFDANGGTCEVESKPISVGAQYGSLPVPEREGYRFDYWYLTCYNATTTPQQLEVSATSRKTTYSNTFLTAHWTKDEGPCAVNGHTMTVQRVVAPTCEQIGYTLYACSVCGLTYEGDSVEALGHDYEMTASVPATAVDNGSCVYTCTRCHNEFTEVLLSTLNSFADLDPGSWYYPYVREVVEAGLMNGTSAEAFSPNRTLTRAMLVTILYRMSGAGGVGSDAFTDVPQGEWYSDAVAWAAANGVVTGYPDNTFRPTQPVTREQVAVILHRYAGLCGYDNSQRNPLTDFADAASISSYATDAVSWANYFDILSGFTDSTMRPQGNATRVQVAKMLITFRDNARIECGVG